MPTIYRDEETKKTPTYIKVNKRLPHIILPANKIKMFADWWNSDIRLEGTVPHSFEEGYFSIDSLPSVSTEKFRPYIKQIAREYHATYRQIENDLLAYIDEMKELTLGFKFTNETNIKAIMFSKKTNRAITMINCTIGIDNGLKDKLLSLDQDVFANAIKETEGCSSTYDAILGEIAYEMLCLLVTCLWYMATATSSTRYIYEEKHPVIEHRHKRTVHVSDTKFIVTPIYDFSKVRTTTVERLVTRKKGWTYSHSFQVHGHYRHYKDGKTIFIESYIKGKGKPFKSQTTILNPDKIKEE